MIKYPDYDRSILSVGSSVLKYFGIIDCEHKSLTDFVYAHTELRAKDLMDAFSKTKQLREFSVQ